MGYSKIYAYARYALCFHISGVRMSVWRSITMYNTVYFVHFNGIFVFSSLHLPSENGPNSELRSFWKSGDWRCKSSKWIWSHLKREIKKPLTRLKRNGVKFCSTFASQKNEKTTPFANHKTTQQTSPTFEKDVEKIIPRLSFGQTWLRTCKKNFTSMVQLHLANLSKTSSCKSKKDLLIGCAACSKMFKTCGTPRFGLVPSLSFVRVTSEGSYGCGLYFIRVVVESHQLCKSKINFFFQVYSAVTKDKVKSLKI